MILAGETAFAVGKETLVDITGVAVVVDEVSPAAREDGLSEAGIKAVVEDKLTRANIMVLEDREWYSVFGGSYLLIKIIASKAVSGDRYAVYIDMELYQTVVLMGKRLGQNINTAAATWRGVRSMSRAHHSPSSGGILVISTRYFSVRMHHS